MPRTKKNPIDSQIEQAWYKLASGVQVSIMDIPKIYAEAKQAHAAGKTIEDAVAEARDKYRKN